MAEVQNQQIHPSVHKVFGATAEAQTMALFGISANRQVINYAPT